MKDDVIRVRIDKETKILFKNVCIQKGTKPSREIENFIKEQVNMFMVKGKDQDLFK